MKYEKISDQELVKLYQNGSENALNELIKRHKRAIFSAIYLMVNDRYLAEDIFQETFIKIINTLKKGNYNEEGKFAGWAVRVARNLCIDYIRKQKRDLTITDSEGNDIFNYLIIVEENQEDKIIRQQTYKDLKELVRLLPVEQREVVMLRHWGNLSFKEIAQITGVSINTSLGRMRYALANLRKLINQKGIKLNL